MPFHLSHRSCIFHSSPPHPHSFKKFLCFSIWDISIGIFSCSLILGCSQSTDEQIKDINFCCCIFLFLAFPFNSFLEFASLCFHYSSLLACCPSLEPLAYSFKFLIWSFKIFAISESAFDACSVSSNCGFLGVFFLPFGMPCDFCCCCWDWFTWYAR